MVNKIFHYVSYFRIVLIIWGCCYAYPEIFFPTANMAENIRTGLLLCGLGMSFDTMKDDTKTRKQAKDFYKNEKLIKNMLIFWSTMFLLVILLSFVFIFAIKEINLGYGILAFGVGGVSLMKTEYNRFNLHRNKRKESTSDTDEVVPEQL